MKRMVLTGAAALMLAGCGGGRSSAVGVNSSESTEITAVGNIVATPSPTATPEADAAPAAAEADNAATAADDNTAAAATDDAADQPAADTVHTD